MKIIIKNLIKKTFTAFFLFASLSDAKTSYEIIGNHYNIIINEIEKFFKKPDETEFKEPVFKVKTI